MCLLREEDDIGSEVSIFQISALLKLRKIIPSANVQLGCGEKKRNGYFFFYPKPPNKPTHSSDTVGKWEIHRSRVDV